MINTGMIKENSTNDNLGADIALIKLTEEVGELNAAFLNHIDAGNKSASSDNNLLEEGCDVINCIVDFLYKTGYNDDQINEMLDSKNTKWRKKIEARLKR